jgi:hypothetical protein
MASWAAVLALTGFRYSGVDHSIQFAAARKPSQVFWSNGYAWGNCKQTPDRRGVKVTLTVLHGSLKIKRLTMTGIGSLDLPKPRTIPQRTSATFLIHKT